MKLIIIDEEERILVVFSHSDGSVQLDIGYKEQEAFIDLNAAEVASLVLALQRQLPVNTLPKGA